MAATAQMRYASGAVYGNVAYDLDRTAEEYELPQKERSYDEYALEKARERARERAAAKEEAKAQTFGLPLLAILGAVAVAALFVVVLLGHVRLAGLSGEIKAVETDIAELEQQREALEIKHNMLFNMSEIETYAVNILGMVKAETSELDRSNVILSDRAQILNEDETATLTARFVKFIKSIPEYFS